MAHRGGRLEIALSGAGPARTLVLDQADPAVLGRLVAAHRRALLLGHEAAEADPWPLSSATEIYLHRLHILVSGHLVELLAPLPRVALVLEGDLLPRLALETAHRPGWPALFEVTQCFRLPRRPTPGRGRRRFRLSQRAGADHGLDSVPLERTLVAAAHGSIPVPTAAGGGVQTLIHLAGHQPLRSVWDVPSGGAAHLVLSGCDSLPRSLPAGVASVAGSLWPVDDQQSTTVMAAYHSRLALGIGPLEALRQAQLLHRPLPPDTWAAYVYLGHPD